jgi:hypothetical protein
VKRSSIKLLGLLAAACSPLRLFSGVVPKDGGMRMALRGAAFRPDPVRSAAKPLRGRASVLDNGVRSIRTGVERGSS